MEWIGIGILLAIGFYLMPFIIGIAVLALGLVVSAIASAFGWLK
jgi:hypothetical protein